MPIWKRIILRAAGFGAGAALTAAMCLGLFVWHKSRPAKPKPWNRGAITAEFYRVSTSSEGDSKLNFEYVLENKTDRDYELQSYATPKIAGKLQDTGSFVGFDNQNELLLKLPIFVPAHQKTRISLTLPSYGFSSPNHLSNTSSDDERRKYYAAVAAHVTQNMSNLDGFVVFDESQRYQIELPNGWKNKSREDEQKSKEKQKN
jgi:hypothetical protein